MTTTHHPRPPPVPNPPGLSAEDLPQRPAPKAPRPRPGAGAGGERAGMSEGDLRGGRDAGGAGGWEAGEPVSDVYLGELAVRMAELRDERLLRILFAVLVVSAATLLVSVFALVV